MYVHMYIYHLNGSFIKEIITLKNNNKNKTYVWFS